ncbi:PREDICTED: achaete-scute homolog 1a-like [Branchiostoma belcheri]|uniref:Achaete-scute homolog 1a-like n=1 Tax=Branchiostoma belcheri TaxID=7741 RepID=A0A6P4ZKB4_BRABE|nr:PREDICTED: achaete-scute homolog 1a-like [Branchiostoma belcheri]
MRDCGIVTMECCKENTAVNVGCDFRTSCLYAKGLVEEKAFAKQQCSQPFEVSDAVDIRTECVEQDVDDKESLIRTVLADTETDSRLGFGASQKHPRKMSRRNERERQRVRMVNMGFANLRNLVPDGRTNKKMSKVETLRSAMEYIRQLKELVEEHDAVTAVLSQAFPRAQAHLPPPSYSYESDGSSNPMSPEEEAELLDFSSWF